MNRKKLLIASAVVLVSTGIVFAANDASAFGWGWKGDDGNSFISRLIERFNLNKDEVNDELGKWREEKQSRTRELQEERLNQAVQDGAITEEQKNKLMERWEQNWQEREQKRQERENWFSENGIDRDALKPYLGKGYGGKGTMRKGRCW